MKKSYVYIITDSERINLHVGLCADIIKTLKFYKEFPTIFFDPKQMLNELVYIEEFKIYDSGVLRLKEITLLNRKSKEELINYANPEWVHLIPGVNIEI